LDAQSEALLDELAASPGVPLSALRPEEARADFLRAAWLGAPADGVTTDDLMIPGPGGPLRLRRYHPGGLGPLPVLVFLHGGGFVLGALEEFDPFCATLAAGAGALVVSVDYRLAPEHKFPAAVEDAVAAVRWVGAHASAIGGDATRIALSGDSAGGNLAAVASIVARDEGCARLVQQVLICPWVDLSSTASDSFRLFGEGPWLSAAGVSWYTDHYLTSRAVAFDPTASPLLADTLGGLPPALVINAEFDVLRDQVVDYARRLREQGTVVDYRLYRGTLHDFVVLPGLFERAGDAIADICSTLRDAWAR
jgi:acetyl esterase